MIHAEIIGAEAVSAKLQAAGGVARGRVDIEVKRLGMELLRKVKEEKLSGQVLNVRTGKLRRSMNVKFENSQDGASASVGTNTVYARIHEFGGQTKRHPILPRNGKALLFEAKGFIGPRMNVKTQGGSYTKAKGKLAKGVAAGGFTFSKGVNHPGSKIPMRSFLRSALNEMRVIIQERLLACVRGLM